MKKQLLTLLSFMVTIALSAEQVSIQQALQKAQQLMSGKRFCEDRSFARSDNHSEGSESAFVGFMQKCFSSLILMTI